MNKLLIKARQELNLSQVEAAKKIGISSGMLAMMETGDRKGSDSTKIKISKFYNMSIDSLFFGNNITNSENPEQEVS